VRDAAWNERGEYLRNGWRGHLKNVAQFCLDKLAELQAAADEIEGGTDATYRRAVVKPMRMAS